MWQCLNNVPRPLSHQHQKLQSSSHCFHCSTTCSPTHTLTHTRSPAHSFSRRLPPPLFLSIPSSTSSSSSSSSSSSLHLSTLPYLCHWKDPPPLLSPPRLSLSHPLPLSLSLHLPSLSPPLLSTSSSHYSAPSDLRCRLQGAVCSNMCPLHPPPNPKSIAGRIQKASVCFTVRPAIHTHRFLKTAPQLRVSARGLCSWAYKAATAWKKEWM